MIAVHGKDVRLGLSWAALWHRRLLLCAVVVAGLGLAGLLLLAIPPVYTAEALVELGMGAIPDDAPPSAPPPGLVRTEMDVLRSRDLAAQVIEQLGLAADPEFNGALPSWLDWSWLDWTGRFTGPSQRSAAVIREATIDNVMEALSVTAGKDSLAIHVRFSSTTPAKAAAIANGFADIYVLEQLKARFDEMQRATGWVSSQIGSLRAQVDSAAVDADSGKTAADQVSALSTELGQAERGRAEAEARLAAAQAWLKSPDGPLPADLLAGSPSLQGLHTREAAALGRLDEMRARYREGSPAVVPLRRELAGIRTSLAAEVRKVVPSLEAVAEQARAHEAQIRVRMEEAGGSARPPADLTRRQREVDLKVGMLQGLLARYGQLANRMETGKSDPRVVSRAMPPGHASDPRPLLVLGLGLAGSLGLAVGLVAALERFRTGFRTTQQIKAELGLPTLGVVPELKRLPKPLGASDYMIDKPTSVYAEAIKSAQLAILDSRPDVQVRRILVASSLPGEGKTSFAVSLARSLAISGYRVLLIDCDFRRPAVGRHFAANPTPGLVDFLWQQAEFEEVVRQDERTGLYYVPAGSRCEDPQKLLDSSLGTTLLHAMMARFDIAIIDTPPTMVASDAAVLAKATDLVLYVVAWDRTPRGAVQAGVEYLAAHGGLVAGVVLSKVDLAKRGRYGDYVDYAFRGGAEYYAK